MDANVPKDPTPFWNWFMSMRDVLRTSRTEAHVDELLHHLHVYCRELYFEIGGHPNGPTELIIKAECKARLFPVARALVDAAPKLDDWKFIALAPPQGCKFKTVYEGIELDPQRCWFMPLRSASDPKTLGLRVACPTYDRERHKTILSGIMVMTETAIGEAAVAEVVGHWEAVALPADPDALGFLKFTDLPDYVAWHRRRVGG